MGLYGGLIIDDIHRKKGSESCMMIPDFMGSTELIANLLHISRTEEELRRSGAYAVSEANLTYNIAGGEVCDAIRRAGGTMPEGLRQRARAYHKLRKKRSLR